MQWLSERHVTTDALTRNNKTGHVTLRRVTLSNNRLEEWVTEESPLFESLSRNAKWSCEIGVSQRGPESWNTEAEGSTTLGDVIRLRLVMAHQTEKR
jgi:hypothetical protein